MKILIVGGGGFIGSWLTRLLIDEKEHEVSIIDSFEYFTSYDKGLIRKVNNFKKKELLKGATVYKKDFLKHGDKLVKKIKPDIIIHLAATPVEGDFGADQSRRQMTTDMELNYEVVKLVNKYNISRLVYMSSLFAYGDHEFAASETHELRPKTPYGISKAGGEFLIRNHVENYNIIRTTSVYGFGDVNNRVTQIIINRASQGKEFWINDSAWLDFIYVKDLVMGIASIINSVIPCEVFHISGGKAMLIRDYVDELEKYYPNMDYSPKEVHDRPKRGTLENTKARVLLDWEPIYDLSLGVEDYMNFVNKYGFA